jgi:hypothetical protein
MVDISDSTDGGHIEAVQQVVLMMVGCIPNRARLRLHTFDDDVAIVHRTESMRDVDRMVLASKLKNLRKYRSAGMTDLAAALHALQALRGPNTVQIVITDGDPTMGTRDAETLAKLACCGNVRGVEEGRDERYGKGYTCFVFYSHDGLGMRVNVLMAQYLKMYDARNECYFCTTVGSMEKALGRIVASAFCCRTGRSTIDGDVVVEVVAETRAGPQTLNQMFVSERHASKCSDLYFPVDSDLLRQELVRGERAGYRVYVEVKLTSSGRHMQSTSFYPHVVYGKTLNRCRAMSTDRSNALSRIMTALRCMSRDQATISLNRDFEDIFVVDGCNHHRYIYEEMRVQNALLDEAMQYVEDVTMAKLVRHDINVMLEYLAAYLTEKTPVNVLDSMHTMLPFYPCSSLDSIAPSHNGRAIEFVE